MSDNPSGETTPATAATPLWGGRFASGPSPEMEALSVSTHFDWVLAPYDIAGSKAHARVLHAAGLLSHLELSSMLSALDDLAQDVETGAFAPVPADEDVHSALERGLLDRAGADLGGKLRAGRSRNDQVATLYRMYLRDRAGVGRPGWSPTCRTRWSARRPPIRVRRCPAGRISSMPSRCCWRITSPPTRRRWPAMSTGSGTGTVGPRCRRTDPAPWPDPRSASTRQRSLPSWASRSSSENSIDGTASRDFAAELAFVLAMLAVDISRWAEEVIVFTTAEFGYARLHDAFATGSSIMPQKKNPDIAELARGKAGRLIGNLTGLLATLKGLPLAYNRDLQEDKEPLIDSVAQLELLLPAVTGMTATLTFNTERMAAMAPGRVLAGHRHRGMACPAGRSVPGGARGGRASAWRWPNRSGRELDELTDEEFAGINPALTPAVRDVLTVAGSLASRDGLAAPPPRVAEQLDALRERILRDRTWAAG